MATISRVLDIPKSSVQYTIELSPQRLNGASISRSGRPRIINERTKAHILRLIRQNPFILYGEIRAQIPLAPSNSTILRMLKESGYGHWRAKCRPKILEQHANIRYNWCMERRNWSTERWRLVVFTDECSVEIGRGKRRRWCFRLNYRNEKWKKDFIFPYNKSKGTSIMVWSAIWGGGHAEIDLLKRDSDS
jgi:hypothetical protein